MFYFGWYPAKRPPGFGHVSLVNHRFDTSCRFSMFLGEARTLARDPVYMFSTEQGSTNRCTALRGAYTHS